MLILAWNIQQGGGTRIREIVNCIAVHQPDVVVLTEFGGTNAEQLQGLLDKTGFVFCETSRPPTWANGVLIASRIPFVLAPFTDSDASEPERRLSVRFRDLEMCGLYFPLRDTKDAFWQATLKQAEKRTASKCLCIGDFNTTQHYVDEIAKSVPGSEYLDELRSLGWVEAWRTIHSETREYTWYHKSSGNGFRLDHAWVSPPLVPCLRRAWYSHTERENRISDHSVLLVEFDFSELEASSKPIIN